MDSYLQLKLLMMKLIEKYCCCCLFSDSSRPDLLTPPPPEGRPWTPDSTSSIPYSCTSPSYRPGNDEGAGCSTWDSSPERAYSPTSPSFMTPVRPYTPDYAPVNPSSRDTPMSPDSSVEDPLSVWNDPPGCYEESLDDDIIGKYKILLIVFH